VIVINQYRIGIVRPAQSDRKQFLAADEGRQLFLWITFHVPWETVRTW